ncbi:Zn-dependent hydrolase [Rhodobacterales bacterium]|nr:Zn-dependent hydrolase [Rhodobacterales bacterium]
MPQSAVSIDLERLKTLLEGVNRFGYDASTGGYNRPGFSDEDVKVRDWFAGQMVSDGLSVRRDAVLNLFGRYGPADGPCIMVGSHLDTVVKGGAWDGALGACVALECVRSMQHAGIEPTTAIEVVATSEEEGRFGGMLGSQTITGTVTPDWVSRACDADGVMLSDAMTAQGLDPDRIADAAWPADSVAAFLELHIEQGPVLEKSSVPIGIADEVSGVCYLEVELSGTANHSGTTPMDLRSDAFAGLAELSVAIPEVIADKGTEQSRITIGNVSLLPNHPHTIPGKAVFSIILRDICENHMRALREELERRAADIASRHGLDLHIDERSWLSPVKLDGAIADRLERLAASHGLPAIRMSSGAGHDAQTMQAFCPSGLIFVPSRGGISHAPEEHSDWADIEKAANLYLHALIEMSA